MPSCVDEDFTAIHGPMLRWLREIYSELPSDAVSALALRLAQRMAPTEKSAPVIRD